MLHWTLRPTQFIRECAGRYGEVFTLRLGVGGHIRTAVIISDPEAVAAIFCDPSLSQTGAPRESIEPVFGSNSILLADGAEHLRQRRLISSSLRASQLERCAEITSTATDRELEGWPLGKPLALRSRMQAVMLEVILSAVFGLDDPANRETIGHHIHRLLTLVANPAPAFAMGLPRSIGLLDLHALPARRRSAADAVLSEEFARRRADRTIAERTDVLSCLLAASDDEDFPLSDAELCDQLVTLLLAGHETTATALAWTFDYLLHTPVALARVVSEAHNEQSSGQYIDAVVSESLRLRPPLPLIQRALTSPMTVQGHDLPAGTRVMLCAYLLHRHPEIYDRPEAFEPERFLGQTPAPQTWFPFGGGTRRCLGASFARLQMRVMLKRVFGRVRLRSRFRHTEAVRRRAIVFAPARGCQVIVEARWDRAREHPAAL
jgi:cytochrome P450